MRDEMLFLGSGDSRSTELGNACAVLLRDGEPCPGIDYGYTAPRAWAEAFGRLPEALFISHAHLDHCAGLESLFYARMVGEGQGAQTRLYCAASLVPLLQARLASLPEPLAEGGANFWDAFQLVPVGERFWHAGRQFRVFPNRHHAPQSSFGLALPGRFLYSGDTRPIPEWLTALAGGDEVIFHDCGLQPNPAHSGLDEILAEYDAGQRARLVAYHLGDEAACQAVERAGLRVARPGDVFVLDGAAGPREGRTLSPALPED